MDSSPSLEPIKVSLGQQFQPYSDSLEKVDEDRAKIMRIAGVNLKYRRKLLYPLQINPKARAAKPHLLGTLSNSSIGLRKRNSSIGLDSSPEVIGEKSDFLIFSKTPAKLVNVNLEHNGNYNVGNNDNQTPQKNNKSLVRRVQGSLENLPYNGILPLNFPKNNKTRSISLKPNIKQFGETNHSQSPEKEKPGQIENCSLISSHVVLVSSNRNNINIHVSEVDKVKEESESYEKISPKVNKLPSKVDQDQFFLGFNLDKRTNSRLETSKEQEKFTFTTIKPTETLPGSDNNIDNGTPDLQKEMPAKFRPRNHSLFIKLKDEVSRGSKNYSDVKDGFSKKDIKHLKLPISPLVIPTLEENVHKFSGASQTLDDLEIKGPVKNNNTEEMLRKKRAQSIKKENKTRKFSSLSIFPNLEDVIKKDKITKFETNSKETQEIYKKVMNTFQGIDSVYKKLEFKKKKKVLTTPRRFSPTETPRKEEDRKNLKPYKLDLEVSQNLISRYPFS